MEVDSDLWLKVLAGAAAIFALPVARWIAKQVQVWRHATRDRAAVLALLPATINQLTAQVRTILDETHPNGGLSIRDSLDRIEGRQVMQEQRWRALASDMDSGLFEADRDGRLVWANRALFRLTGRSISELEGYGWFSSIAQEDRASVSEEYLAACKYERELEINFGVQVGRGETQPMNLRCFRLRGATGVVGYVNILEPYRERGQ